ncbi:MAG: J domain-containing protein [Hydrococcus sp. C42_A2020_068]|uniref:J domain-containing protein n=1 Tax=Pleurocapsa sp. PCC 7327 TaxID=118163 RepID=UPI00029FEC80|nr:J domain-containing protein [Pleurocapsa sp. PCC 7327]AFY79089.1 DnaJ-class molecular chaperone with C-terminal Zn finger domain [Pleurocapsa sp. PCC 7327]MBF2022761.1 J domain-containing protein [Hydrococcus sp. C42_A2020_068]
MGVIPIDENLLLSFFLFGLSICTTSVISYTSKNSSRDRSHAKIPKRSQIVPKGKFYRLACLLEDAPRSSLRGQAYQLATPIMTPLACLLEDAPETALKGQVYELATPLMTPLACIATEFWQEFYTRQLGKPGIHYWEWKDKPESDKVCRELSLLLTLPEPKGYAKQVLSALGEGKDLFCKSLKSAKEVGNLLVAFADSMDDGKFANLDWRVQIAMRRAFKEWHELASQQIGIEALDTVYRVCYGSSWNKIQQMLDEDRSVLEDFIADESSPWWKILGVSPSADPIKVERAYKNLIRLWHPDLNKHPYATQVTSRINVAYERYQSLHPFPSMAERMSIKNNANLFDKIREWLKPLLSR